MFAPYTSCNTWNKRKYLRSTSTILLWYLGMDTTSCGIKQYIYAYYAHSMHTYIHVRADPYAMVRATVLVLRHAAPTLRRRKEGVTECYWLLPACYLIIIRFFKENLLRTVQSAPCMRAWFSFFCSPGFSEGMVWWCILARKPNENAEPTSPNKATTTAVLETQQMYKILHH